MALCHFSILVSLAFSVFLIFFSSYHLIKIATTEGILCTVFWTSTLYISFINPFNLLQRCWYFLFRGDWGSICLHLPPHACNSCQTADDYTCFGFVCFLFFLRLGFWYNYPSLSSPKTSLLWVFYLNFNLLIHILLASKRHLKWLIVILKEQ